MKLRKRLRQLLAGRRAHDALVSAGAGWRKRSDRARSTPTCILVPSDAVVGNDAHDCMHLIGSPCRRPDHWPELVCRRFRSVIAAPTPQLHKFELINELLTAVHSHYPSLIGAQPISEFEYDTALSTFAFGKQPGLDGLPAALYKSLAPAARRAHAELLSLRLDECISQPTHWCHTRAVLLPKDRGKFIDLHRSRPISMQCFDLKLLLKIVLFRIRVWSSAGTCSHSLTKDRFGPMRCSQYTC